MEEGVYEMTYLLLHHMRILICTLSRSETIACVYIAYHRLVLLGRGRARAQASATSLRPHTHVPTHMHAFVSPVKYTMVGTPSLPASTAFALTQPNVLFGGTRVILLANALAPTP